MDLERAREIAREAAELGGQVIRSSTASIARPKGRPGDWVTEVDLASERAIAEYLRRESGIPVHGEEEGGGGRDTTRWLVDPLDGTTNFVHGFPLVGVAVALVDEGRATVGCVHAPFTGESYVGARGQGAYVVRAGATPEPLRVSSRPAEHAIVATGFPFRDKARLPVYLRAFAQAVTTFEDLRRAGAASLDLAWVAAGIFDGFFELGLAAWDVAAGGLLIEEAGGRVTDWAGGDDWLAGDIVAGPPAVHPDLLRIATSSGAATEPT